MTEASGVWINLSVVMVLYAAVGTATVLVLQAMTTLADGQLDDREEPYAPRPDLQDLTEESA